MRRTGRFARGLIAIAATGLLLAGCSSGNGSAKTPATTDSHGLPIAHTLYRGEVTGGCVDATLGANYDIDTGVPTDAFFTGGPHTAGTVTVTIKGGGSVSPSGYQSALQGQRVVFQISGANRKTRIDVHSKADRSDLRKNFEGVDCKPSKQTEAALATSRDYAAEAARHTPVPANCTATSRKDPKFKLSGSVAAKARTTPAAILVTVKVSKSSRVITDVDLAPTGLAGVKVTPARGNPTHAIGGAWRFTVSGQHLTTSLANKVTFRLRGAGQPTAACTSKELVAWPN